jgi:Fe-S oxidoreductase
MCPSFMATLDEAHATRGRANALRLAMSGHVPGDLSSDALAGVFDLCLSCKACKAECPSSVDVARLKAEFLAARYDRKGIPLTARIFGNVHRINEMMSRMPRLANFMMRFPLGKLGARLVGLPTKRPLPLLARQRFSAKEQVQHETPDATLIIDTFTEFNHPEIGAALLNIVEKLGLKLNVARLPDGGCCGRPAISKGLLDQAKMMAAANVEFLAALDGPILWLEPSCLSAITDDYADLVPADRREAARLTAEHSMSVESWLAEHLEKSDLTWAGVPQKILLHGHCHQKALWGTGDTLRLLRSMPGAEVAEIDSGCCGVAGSFGYEHYDLSLKIGNQRLLPTIADNPDAAIAAPGTSCRAQIHDAGYAARHPVQIVADALG